MSSDEEPLVIASSGDVILDVSQDSGPRFSYRVDSRILQSSSRYFGNLLSSRFREGQRVVAVLQTLALSPDSNIADVTSGHLPRISIVNVGRIAISKASSLQKLFADFLHALHDGDLGAAPPIANLANLAVVADRFGTAACLCKYVRKKKYVQTIDAKSKEKAMQSLAEERVRQKLLIGLLFDSSTWVLRYSKYMIIMDSQQWQQGATDDHSRALWWDIPYGVEEELIKRREYILETINSLQAHFLKLYTSVERQCKLGYDTSLQCDSFQLGEMVRFFTKIDTLRLQGRIYDETEPTYHVGDIGRLLTSLRQCPNYQIDSNHSHCGLRARLLPLLEYIQGLLDLDSGSPDIGICTECWHNHRAEYAWSRTKRPVLWSVPRPLASNRRAARNLAMSGSLSSAESCLSRHVLVRNLFMAAHRDWTPRDVS